MYRTVNNLAPQMNNTIYSPYSYTFNSGTTQSFITGEDAITHGKSSRPYRDYMSDHCSTNWDSVCDVVVNDQSNIAVPYYNGDYEGITYYNLSAGELILKSTAQKKYISSVNSTCSVNTLPYNAQLSATALTTNYGPNCKKIYSVDATTIDKDKVMDALLLKPVIAPEVLVNIYLNMTREKTLSTLDNTKLGHFYKSPTFRHLLMKYGPIVNKSV